MTAAGREVSISAERAAQLLAAAASSLSAFGQSRDGSVQTPGAAWAALEGIAREVAGCDSAPPRSEDDFSNWPATRSRDEETGESHLALSGAGQSAQFLLNRTLTLEAASSIAADQSFFVSCAGEGWSVLYTNGAERREVDRAGVAQTRAELSQSPDYVAQARKQSEEAQANLELQREDARRFPAELSALVRGQADAVQKFRDRHRPKPAPSASAPLLSCAFCDAPMEASDRYCAECGTAPVTVPGPPVAANCQARSAPVREVKCDHCGSLLYARARFCPKCGDPRAATRPAAAPPPVRPAPPKPAAPPAPPASGMVLTFVRAIGRTGPRGPRQGSPEAAIAAFAERVVGAIQHLGIPTQAGIGALLARLIRAGLAEGGVYRETANNPALQGQSWGALLTSFALSGGGISVLSFGAVALKAAAFNVGLRLAMVLAGMVVVRLLASRWQGREFEFGRIFRPMAMAQAPLCLQLLPLVGELATLWCLVTNTVAVRAATGCDAGRSAILSAVSVGLSSYGASLLSTRLAAWL